MRTGGDDTGTGTLDYTAIVDGEFCKHDRVRNVRMMEGKRMRTIDTVYEAWQEDFYRREDPEEIGRASCRERV